MNRDQHHTFSEQETAVGWISMVDLFLLVSGLLLAGLFLYQAQLANAGSANDRLRRQEQVLSREASELAGKVKELRAEVDRQAGQLAQTMKDEEAHRRLRQEVEGLQASLRQREMQLVKLQGLDQENGRLRDALRGKQRELESLKSADDEKQAALRQVSNLQEELKRREQRVATLIEENKQLVQATNTLRDQLRSEQRLSADRQASLNKAQEALGAMKVAGEASAREAAALQKKHQALIESQENRFEGIDLKGTHVVFLIDMSGSMELLDINTGAPAKWAGVAENVGRVMKSLPDLKKFQAVVFSETARFLLGREAEWLDFSGPETADRLVAELKKIKPRGGTNLHAGFELAFRLRAEGLDTIYLFSDGLPNLGEGLSAADERALAVLPAEQQATARGDKLARHLRTMIRTRWNPGKPDQERVRINSVGFFYESPDLGSFLWGLSRENGGSFVGMSRP